MFCWTSTYTHFLHHSYVASMFLEPISQTTPSCSVRNMSLFNSRVPNMMFFTCYLCFAIIWNIVSPNLSCSITKSLIYYDKWATNANLSSIFKSPWTCKPSWWTWFRWMKHNSNTCLSKYNVLMVNSTLHPIFIKPPHLFLESRVPLWFVLDGITFPLTSNFLDLHYDFV
jgi:hypothetical protein